MRGIPEIFSIVESPSKVPYPFFLINEEPYRTDASKDVCKATTNDEFQVVFDVSSFKPEEISIKLTERDIVVEGKHEEREAVHGFISRQFTRRITLPKDFDTETLTTYLNKDGKLTIKALKPKTIEPKERIIPIKRIIGDEDLISKKLKL